MKSVLVIALCFVTVAVGKPPKECKSLRPKIPPSDCCTGSGMFDEAGLAECTAQYPDSSEEDTKKGPGRHHGKEFCIWECHFNKTGIFKDGEPVKSVALDIFGKSADASGTTLLNNAIDECIAKHTEMKARRNERDSQMEKLPPPPPQDGDKKRCNPAPAFFYRCVSISIFKNCPSANLVKSEECTSMTEFVGKCLPPNMK